MAHLYDVKEHHKHKLKHRHKEGRFYTQLDLSIIKHDSAVMNSRIKRGEIKPEGNNFYVEVCGCGAVGCFIHGNYKSHTQAPYLKFK